MKRATRQPSSFTDAQLSAALRGLREEVAAPALFRARVLARLAEAGALDAPAQPAKPSFLEQLRAAFSPAKLALAGAAAAAVAIVTLSDPHQTSKAQPSSSPSQREEGRGTVAKAPAEVRKGVGVRSDSQASPALASAPKPPSAQPSQAQAPAALEEPWQALATDPQSSASSTQASSPFFHSQSVAGSGGQSKPIEIVVKPSPTALVQPVLNRSEVRQNVARVSRGEQALIYVRLGEPGRVKISVRDRLGRVVAVLKDTQLGAGLSEIRWGGQLDNGALAPTGIYQVLIQGPGFEDRHKLMLVK